ncbi:MAG: hypothetical protein ACYCUI_07055 [Vulcanimicrobiaceae bacterium]
MNALRAYWVRIDRVWRSDYSTAVGVSMALSGLVTSSAGANALEGFGIPAHVVQIASGVAVVLGALLTTPKNRG